MPPKSRHPADNIPEEWNPKFVNLMNRLLSSDGPKRGRAALASKCSAEYLRPKDLLYWLWDNYSNWRGDFTEGEDIFLCEPEVPDKPGASPSEAPGAMYPDGFDIETLRPLDFIPLATRLLRASFYYRADRVDVQLKEGEEEEEVLDDEEARRTAAMAEKRFRKDERWPRRLIPYPVGAKAFYDFSMDSFYVVSYAPPSTKTKSYFVLGAIIMGVLAVTMFPAWPKCVRQYSAYFSMALASGLVLVSILRLLTFVLLWYCGYDFWIFPNMMSDDAGILDLFRPVYSFKSRRDGFTMYLVRIAAFGLMIITTFKLGETHSITDVGDFVQVQLLDFVEWGVNKITGDGTELMTSNFEGLDGLDPAVASKRAPFFHNGVEFKCISRCKFDSYHDMEEDCLTDCECFVELRQNSCLKKCGEDVIAILNGKFEQFCANRSEGSSEGESSLEDNIYE